MTEKQFESAYENRRYIWELKKQLDKVNCVRTKGCVFICKKKDDGGMEVICECPIALADKCARDLEEEIKRQEELFKEI